jgi:hypothetical protein
LIDFQTANEANLEGLGDDIVLALAASENRILISHDRRTMPHHFGEFIQHQNCPGVFIVRKIFQDVEDRPSNYVSLVCFRTRRMG